LVKVLGYLRKGIRNPKKSIQGRALQLMEGIFKTFLLLGRKGFWGTFLNFGCYKGLPGGKKNLGRN